MIKSAQSHLIIILLLILVTGCSSIPQNTSNSCDIFDEKIKSEVI